MVKVLLPLIIAESVNTILPPAVTVPELSQLPPERVVVYPVPVKVPVFVIVPDDVRFPFNVSVPLFVITPDDVRLPAKVRIPAVIVPLVIVVSVALPNVRLPLVTVKTPIAPPGKVTVPVVVIAGELVYVAFVATIPVAPPFIVAPEVPTVRVSIVPPAPVAVIVPPLTVIASVVAFPV